VLILFGACAYQNERLIKLEQTYLSTKQDPQIAQNASIPLYEARKTMDKAAKAKDEEEMSHLIDIAEKQLEIAKVENDRKVAEQYAEELQKRRDSILLEAREREANESRMRANVAEFERDQAKEKVLASEEENQRLEQEKRKLSKHASHLESQLLELKTRETERGLEITLQDTLFEFGKADLKPGAARNLDKLALVLRENPNRNALIEGHTDSIGTDAYNNYLSKMRANRVKNYLVQKGISTSRITVKGYGESYPVASNTTDAGRQQNRRVDIVLIPEGKSTEDILRQ
jgi:outer membrane protein OmpA-like peptidoglycan-associated protein